MSKARGLADLGNAYSDGALSNRNLIINGAMQVAQRGTSFTGIGSATYTLDRWRGQSRAGSVINVSKVDNIDVDGRIMSVLQHQVTTAASDGLTLQNQFVEDGSISLLGQTVTVSCWARVTVGSATLEQQFEVDGGVYSFTSGVTNLTSSFQRITFSTTLNGYTTSITNKHLRYQLYIRGASAHTVQITGVQLEAGDTATPFEHRSYGGELARCQRYYEVAAQGGHIGGFTYYNTTNSYGAWRFRVEKRAAPTVSASGSTAVSVLSNGSAYQSTAIAFANTEPASVRVSVITSARTNGHGAWVNLNNGYFIADAEL